MQSWNRWGMRLVSAAAALLLLAAPASAGAVPVEEGPMYNSFTYAVSRGKIYALESPAPYQVEAQVNTASLGAPLLEPSDLCVFNNEVYIADSAGNCVLSTDGGFQLLGVVDRFVWQGKEETFSRPEGVFVTAEHLYVADTGNRRIVVLNHDGSCFSVIGKPDTDVLSADLLFEPRKSPPTARVGYTPWSRAYTKASWSCTTTGASAALSAASRWIRIL